MKKIKLDKKEDEILQDFEKGKYKSVLKEKIPVVRDAAKASLNKNRNINLRVAEKDLLKIKQKSLKAGIPYQTIISSLMHKYAEGEIDLKI